MSHGTRVLIFGNSGSGKSTLARSLSESKDIAHFDLDSIAWLPTNPPERTPIGASTVKIDQFLSNNNNWVIEGCYADLIELAIKEATMVIFLNLSVEDCIANAKARPWEPHKYDSKEAQDANLEMLIAWISAYPDRDDVCSLNAHQQTFGRFSGSKTMISQRSEISQLLT